MPGFVKKLLFFAFFLVLFILVVLYVPPPKSWQEASILQIMAFFLPILLGFTSLADILMHYLPRSFILALGIILLIAFFGANQLNYLTGVLIILVTAFSVRTFPKMKLPRFRLTSGSKIPKLHMQKQESQKESPRLRRLRRLKT